MMFLTVIFSILSVTTAIRVPTVWPEQENRIPDLTAAQNAYVSNAPYNNFKIISNRKNADVNKANNKGIYIPNLEQQADAFYISPPLIQNKRHPSGSRAEFVIIDTGKTQNLKDGYNNIREPDVRYTVPHFIKNKSNAVSHVNIATKPKKEYKVYYNREDPSRTKTRHNNPKSNSFSQPVVYVDNNVNFPTFADGWMPIIAQQNPHKIQESNNIHTYHNLNPKRNQIPNRAVNQRRSQPLNLRRQHKDPNDRLDAQPANNYQYVPQNRRVNKNYRDDITYEPSNAEKIIEVNEENENAESEDDDGEGNEKLQVEDFESLKTVPTKPIYPGEGKWAIRGLKHRPFISNHEFEVLRDDGERPEGYETFERTAPTYDRQQRTFSAKLQAFPQKHGLDRAVIREPEAAAEEDHEEVREEEEEGDQDGQKGEDDFIPTRSLSQVRKTETEEYLPRDPEEARLREVIKDSKIHTVYTEEGYEDIAYDHAGHEKEAEDSEGHAGYRKKANKVKQKIPKGLKSGFEAVDVEKEFEKYSPSDEEETNNSEREEALDADVSASNYNDADPKKNMEIKDFTTTKENRTKEIKDMDDEMELEITSEIKIMTKPNNVSTAHKFVKIVPKNKNKASGDDTNSKEVLKRRKRYVNDFYKIDVDKDFLDVLVSEKPKPLPILTTEKYPYYRIRDTNLLDKNSPLRYAEDLKNMPIKIPGRMSFYEQARISECPEIPRNVDPIPDRVNEAEKKGKGESESKGNGFAGLPDVPRLRNLGDKIDCLKIKLFGENPLDSPIFKESIIDAPRSFFKELDPVDEIIKIYSGADLANNEEELKKIEKLPDDVVSHFEELDERLDTEDQPKQTYSNRDPNDVRKENESDNPTDAYSAWGNDEDYDERYTNREEDENAQATKPRQNEDYNIPNNDSVESNDENEDNDSLVRKSAKLENNHTPINRYLKPNEEDESSYNAVNQITRFNKQDEDNKESSDFINDPAQSNEHDEDSYAAAFRKFLESNAKEEYDEGSHSSINEPTKSEEDKNNYVAVSESPESKAETENDKDSHESINESADTNKHDEINYIPAKESANSKEEIKDNDTTDHQSTKSADESDNSNEDVKSNEEEDSYGVVNESVESDKQDQGNHNPINEEVDDNHASVTESDESRYDLPEHIEKEIAKEIGYFTSQKEKSVTPESLPSTAIPKHIYDRIDYIQNLATSEAPILEKEDVTTEAYNQLDLVQNVESSDTSDLNSASSTKPPVSEASLHDQIVKTTEQIVASTTAAPSTNEVVKPKHIYDQIDLVSTPEEGKVGFLNDNANTQKLTQDFYQITKQNYDTISDNRKQKSLGLLYNSNLNPISNQNINLSDNHQNPLYASNPNKENLTNINSIDSQPINVRPTNSEESLPETAALRILLKRRRRPHRPHVQLFDVNKFLPTPLPPILPYSPHTVQIFDVNKYLPTPLPPILTYSPSTVLPKYKTLSEVYYKDEIQPNEQLNVFADVINNIKNSPPEALAAESSEYLPTIQESWNTVNTQRSAGKKIKVPPRKIRIKQNDSASSYSTIDNTIYRTTTTTTTTTTSTTAAPRKRRRNKYKNHKPDPQVYEEYLQTIKANSEDLLKLNSKEPETSQTIHSYKKNKQPEITNLKSNYFVESTSFYNPILNREIPTGIVLDDVIGLAPPAAPVTISEAGTLNTYIVSGMKPPSISKPYVYTSFRLPQNNRVRRKNYHHRISKRSPAKPTYSEIRRNRHSQSSSESKEEKEEEDDYVPKRNRNFHYDVENDRVVYLNKKEEEKEEIVPETQVEEVEEDEGEYLTLTKPQPKPKFVVITTERNGPSFLEYIHQLKSNSNYRVILDPVKTKKPSEEPKEKADLKEMESTTSKQVETAVPEFLSIISKLKSADGYKEIKEKKEKATTTATPEEEDEIEAEVEEVGNVKNSPGAAQDSSGFDKTQIFDISEFLPQPKNYSPRTVIDYSKYKTIQRAPVATRHNLSSRYNSEDDELPFRHRDTTQTPILATSEDNIKSGSSEEEVIGNRRSEENTRRSGYSSSEEDVEKSTTQFAEVTTSRPTRPRVRNRKRPTTTTTTPAPTELTTTLRRRTRLRSRPTTTAEPLLEENYSHTQRVVQRRRIPVERISRQDQRIPSNHKAIYTPLLIDDLQGHPRIPAVQRKRKVPRIVTPQQIQLPINATEKSKSSDKGSEVDSSKLAQVQVFQKYDPNKKHGGNYRREEENDKKEDDEKEQDNAKEEDNGKGEDAQAVEVNSVSPTDTKTEDSKKVERLTDVVPKPYAFYSDPMLPKNVNQLKDSKAAENLSSDSDEKGFSNVKHSSDKDYSEEFQDEVKINFNKNSETVTKKPVQFVKDPSKRLYFYAPVK